MHLFRICEVNGLGLQRNIEGNGQAAVESNSTCFLDEILLRVCEFVHTDVNV